MTAYIIFVTAFILLLVSIGAYLPVDVVIVEGVSEADIEALRTNVVLPEQPTIIDYLVTFFAFVYSIVVKILILLRISTPHQFIALIITPFLVGLVWKIARLVRGGGG